jgi:hypothetical protein
MSRLTVLALRALIAVLFAGLLFVQTFLVPLLMIDLEEAPDRLRWPVGVIVILGVLTVQVALVAIWRLLTMAARGTVFHRAAFRFVDVVIGAAVAAWLLAVVLAFVLAPGEEVPPGAVALVVIAGVAAAGIALLMLVMRALLAQATSLRTELEEVI